MWAVDMQKLIRYKPRINKTHFKSNYIYIFNIETSNVFKGCFNCLMDCLSNEACLKPSQKHKKYSKKLLRADAKRTSAKCISPLNFGLRR